MLTPLAHRLAQARSVELWIAPDARPRELRCALTQALGVPESTELRLLRRVRGERLVACAFSAGLLLSDSPALVLDVVLPVPRPPSWLRAHAPQLCGMLSLSAFAVMPAPYAALALLPLALSSAAVNPGPPGLLPRAISTAGMLLTAYVVGVVHESLLPSLLAALGFLAALASSMYRLRVLLLSVGVMLAELVVARAAAMEARLRKPPARLGGR